MQRRNPPDHTNRDSQANVDLDKLDSLAQEAVSLLESGNATPAELVLAHLEEGEREFYREPLLDRLARVAVATIDTSHSIGRDVDHHTLDPEMTPDPSAETIALPPALRLPNKDTSAQSLPESIGKFRIKGELGRGAFGVVYLGYDEELLRNVAIKVSLVSDPNLQERLRIEASKAAQIESNGIVPVYHIGKTDNGKVYIVQKYIEGSSLRDVVKKGPLSPDCAARLMREIALGLEPAHLQDIIHRDLKPDNVLISHSGRAWIADFGLAISEEEQQDRQPELAGTPPYMSPEQIKGRIDFLDPRSDIWALGVMYYELLCGRLPFHGKTRNTLKEQICERDPRPLHQIAPNHLSESMHRIFERCCAKKPADRYATVRELADDLQELIFDGLSDQNIHGQEMTAHLGMGTSEYETAGSQFRTGRGTTRRETNIDSSTAGSQAGSVQSASKKRRAAVMATLGLTAAGIVAYPFYLNATVKSDSVVPLVTVVPEPGLKRNSDTPGSQQAEAADVSTKAVGASPQVDTESTTPEDPIEPLGMALDLANGSEEKPWVVSSDGTGSHRTIAEAIAASSPGAFITVVPGVYRESLHLSSAVTIVGQIEGEGEDKIVCNLRNDQESPVNVDCPGSKVTIRGMAIDGEGHRTKKEFNAINLRGGTLVIEDCDLRTSSFNCIKVQNDSVLGVRNCRFLDSREYAISTKDHQSVLVVGCTFLRSGVQLVGGTGRVEQCQFFGNQGCYISHSTQSVEIADCTFDHCQDYGIAVAVGGKVVVNNTELLECGLALNVQSGELVVGRGSRIEGGRMGAGVTQGTLSMTDVSMADLDQGIFVTDDATVTLSQFFIDRCRDTGIVMQAGKLTFVDGKIENCGVGAMVGDETRWPEITASATFESVEINRCASYAIAAYSGPTRLSDLDISECTYGLYVQGPAKEPGGDAAEAGEGANPRDGKPKSAVEVSAENIRFTSLEKVAVLARGDCTVRHQGLEIDPEASFQGAVAVGGAEIIAANP